MTKKMLMEYGLTENQAEIYLGLLKKPGISASEISKLSGLYRPYVYDTINGLLKKGLVSFTIKSGKKIFQPVHPQKLVEEAELKTERIKKAVSELDIGPDFVSEIPQIEIFEGNQGLKTIYQEAMQEALKGKITFYKYLRGMKEKERMLPFFIPQAVRKIRKQKLDKKIKFQGLVHSALKKEKFPFLDDIGLKNVRFLKKGNDQIPTIMILNNQIIIFLKGKNSLFIRIKSDKLSREYAGLFDYLWERAN